MPRRTAVRSPFLPRYWIWSASSDAGSAAAEISFSACLQVSQVGAQALEIHAAVSLWSRASPPIEVAIENLEPRRRAAILPDGPSRGLRSAGPGRFESQAALATATILAKVAASRIAMSARILRSNSILAVLRAWMKCP